MQARVWPGLPADPFSFWQSLHPHPTHGFFLGSGAGTKQDSVIYMSAGEPSRVWRADPSSVSSLFKKIKTNSDTGSDVPRYVGFLGFEAGRSFDRGIKKLPKHPNPLKTPGAWFGDFPAVVKIDFLKKQTTLYWEGTGAPTSLNPTRQKAWREGQSLSRSTGPFQYMSQGQFSKMVLKAKEAISRGDIYQANLSLRFQSKFNSSPIDLYRRLCKRNPSPYACLLKFGPDWLVSCSPELLLKTEGRRVITRPIAGTRPRGRTASLDARRRGQLLLSPKERAEHVMLVDLERNDLGRVCAPGSVKVTDSYAVERYSHVMHIVSQVEGKLSSRKNWADALQAVFPGGTITGCPKIKSIEIIQALEKTARGPFYGSAGFICGNGDATFNILIRTALIKNKKIFIQAGAGIVADSQPAREYREVLAKAQALLESAGGKAS